MWRAIHESELLLLRDLLSTPSISRAFYDNAIAHRVRQADKNGTLIFEIGMEEIRQHHLRAADAYALDSDGVEIQALVFVKGDEVSVLEVYKVDGSDVERMPPAGEFIRVNE